jgi:hypothetical protein
MLYICFDIVWLLVSISVRISVVRRGVVIRRGVVFRRSVIPTVVFIRLICSTPILLRVPIVFCCGIIILITIFGRRSRLKNIVQLRKWYPDWSERLIEQISEESCRKRFRGS